jgi:predicted enzyme related to lactoylglutathione lyase
MTVDRHRTPAWHLPHGRIGYVQLPALDTARSAAFYEAVFGWSVDPAQGSFEAPDMIGQWTTERPPAPGGGPVLWIHADDLGPTLQAVERHGGRVAGRPQLDGGERWLAEVDDPAGNRIGVVVAAGAPQPQTLLAVADVEASSRWYQHLLGLRSGHGGPHYERLLADGTLVLQLHHRETPTTTAASGTPTATAWPASACWCGSGRWSTSTGWWSAPRRWARRW